MSNSILIGAWAFTPETGTLLSGEDTVRLENRAANLLEYLCRHAGDLVAHEDIIEHVWDGRFVSPNSVAVVISDIRKALGDNPKKPLYIETIPKRGYRFIAHVETPVTVNPTDKAARSRRPLYALIATLLLMMSAIVVYKFLTVPKSPSDLPQVYVLNVVNDTGNPDYDALSASVTELIKVQVNQHASLQLTNETAADIEISSKLILWDGHPSLSLHALKDGVQAPIWSGMASGPETLLPRQVREEIREFVEAQGQ